MQRRIPLPRDGARGGPRLHHARGGGAQVVVGLHRRRFELVELALAEHGPPIGRERFLLGSFPPALA